MQQAPQKNKTNDSRYLIIGMIIVLFAVLELLIVGIELGRALERKREGSVELPSDGTQAETDTEASPVGPDAPVFSGGVIPTPPYATSGTATLSGISSPYGILINAESGEIVAQKNADARFEPASMTKVMTLIVACEYFKESDLDRKLTVTQEAWDYARTGAYEGASVVNHDVGDEVTVRDLLYGIGMESAADCTVMIINEVAGGEAAFVALMNRKAEELGLENTHFDNAIGHESAENYTTASEMARIMQYALQSNLIKDILSVKQRVFYPYYYDESGTYKSFRFTYYSTLFRSRMDTYKKHAGKDFALASATLEGGKTGSFIETSFVVCWARANAGGEYILVLGNAPKADKPASYYTMCDIKTVLDTYLK